MEEQLLLPAFVEMQTSSSSQPLFACSSTESAEYGDLSTGYLEDALIEIGIRFKRRRLTTLCSESDDHHHGAGFGDHLGGLLSGSAFVDARSNDQDEGISMATTALISSSSSSSKLNSASSSHFAAYNDNFFSRKASYLHGERGGGVREKGRQTRVVVYPFGLVKPGGVDGDVTLKDINQRILMPPTRPVRHPVGEYACRPCISPDGPGLSGKAVVALTRVHTQGRGTITIVRTKD